MLKRGLDKVKMPDWRFLLLWGPLALIKSALISLALRNRVVLAYGAFYCLRSPAQRLISHSS